MSWFRKLYINGKVRLEHAFLKLERIRKGLGVEKYTLKIKTSRKYCREEGTVSSETGRLLRDIMNILLLLINHSKLRTQLRRRLLDRSTPCN